MSTQYAPVAADTTPAATGRQNYTWTPTAERYLLALVADGYTHRQIARRLGVTAIAVNRHTQRVYRGLGATNAPHAVAIAIRDRLIPATARPSEAFAVVGPQHDVVLRAPAPNQKARQL